MTRQIGETLRLAEERRPFRAPFRLDRKGRETAFDGGQLTTVMGSGRPCHVASKFGPMAPTLIHNVWQFHMNL